MFVESPRGLGHRGAAEHHNLHASQEERQGRPPRVHKGFSELDLRNLARHPYPLPVLKPRPSHPILRPLSTSPCQPATKRSSSAQSPLPPPWRWMLPRSLWAETSRSGQRSILKASLQTRRPLVAPSLKIWLEGRCTTKPLEESS